MVQLGGVDGASRAEKTVSLLADKNLSVNQVTKDSSVRVIPPSDEPPRPLPNSLCYPSGLGWDASVLVSTSAVGQESYL